MVSIVAFQRGEGEVRLGRRGVSQIAQRQEGCWFCSACVCAQLSVNQCVTLRAYRSDRIPQVGRREQTRVHKVFHVRRKCVSEQSSVAVGGAAPLAAVGSALRLSGSVGVWWPLLTKRHLPLDYSQLLSE